MKAQETVDYDTTKIVTERQRLRDITNSVDPALLQMKMVN